MKCYCMHRCISEYQTGNFEIELAFGPSVASLLNLVTPVRRSEPNSIGTLVTFFISASSQVRECLDSTT